jgi:UDP:flavonoid glycosyltransferase YjiC (YdhE family)
MPVESPSDAVAMISAVCAELGERALVCSGSWNVDDIPHADHVKILRAVNHAAVLPLCRAVVHHGGAGTTAAGVRAEVPTLILWVAADQPIWANQIERMKVVIAQPFSCTIQNSLLAALRSVLGPQFVTRAREVSSQVTKPSVS